MANLKKHKILYIDTIRQIMGGAQHGLYDIIRSLNREKFEPLVLFQTLESPLIPMLKDIGVEVRTLRIGNIPSMLHRENLPVYYPFAHKKMIRVFKEIRPNLIHSNHFHAAKYAAPAASRLNIPHVTSIRSIYFDCFCNLNRTVEKAIIRNSNLVCCNSSAAMKELHRRHQSDSIIVVKNAIDTSIFEKKVDRNAVLSVHKLDLGKRYLAYVAEVRAGNYKGHEDMLRAFPQIVGKHPDVALLMIGNDAPGANVKAQLKEMAVKLQIDKNVFWIDKQKNIHELMKASYAVVLASPLIEGLPRVVLESMASGKPVVATDVGGVKDALRAGFNGFLAEPGNHKSLSMHIIRLLDLPEGEYRNMCQNAFESVRKEFDLSRLIGDFEKIYLDLIEKYEPAGDSIKKK